MIEFIRLRNFQSHRHSQLEFSPGVNVIVGESDHGKTAIMRALYWVIFGKPAGDSMVRHNQNDDCEVTIETKDHVITRIRGTTKNQYIINDQVLKGFGQTVPEPVTAALNINEINFMRQLDPPFLFSKTAGEVAQYLNRLINLDVIDTSLSNIKRMHSQADGAATGHLAEARRLEQELAGFDWTAQADKDITKLEQKEKKIERLKKTAEELDNLLDVVFDAQETVKETAYAKQLTKQVDSLIKRREAIADKTIRGITIRKVISHVQQTQTALHSIAPIKGAEKAIAALEKRLAKHRTAEAEYFALYKATGMTQKLTEEANNAIYNARQSSIQLQKAMPDVCPLCDQEIK